MAIVMENVRTTDGKLYVGMTRDEANAQGKRIAKCFFELNTDCDDVLSFDEIMQQHGKVEKKRNVGKNILGCAALYYALVSPKTMAKAEEISYGWRFLTGQSLSAKTLLASSLVQTLLLTCMAAHKLIKNKKLQRQDNEYFAQYQELLKAEQQQKETEQIEQLQSDETEPHEVNIAA